MEEEQKDDEAAWAEMMAEDNYDPTADENYVASEEEEKKKKKNKKPNKSTEKRNEETAQEANSQLVPSDDQPLQQLAQEPVAQDTVQPHQPQEGVPLEAEVQVPQEDVPPEAEVQVPQEDVPPEVEVQVPQEDVPPEAGAQVLQEDVPPEAGEQAVVAEIEELNEEEMDQLQQLAQQMQPINELEPGFPQLQNFLINHPIPKEPEIDEQGIVIVPPLPVLNGFPRAKQQIPNARIIRQIFNHWPEAKQQMFLEDMRQEFGEFIGKVEAVVVDIAAEDNVKDEMEPAFIGFAAMQALMGFDEQAKKAQEEKMLMEIVMEEEREENAQQLRNATNASKRESKKKEMEIIDVLKRGLSGFNEAKELTNIRSALSGNRVPVFEPQSVALPSTGRVSIDNQIDDQLIALFKKITFQGQIVLSRVTPHWNELLSSMFSNQTYLWFCNESQNSRRFLPIEVCCEDCKHLMDSEPVIRVYGQFFFRLINEVLANTKNLKCLRLYRFSFDRIIIVRKLHENCPKLKHLDLTECFDLKVSAIQELSKDYPNLSHLILNSTNLSEEMLEILLRHMQSLKTLVVSSTLIRGQALSLLPKSLERLDIRCCPKLTSESMNNFLQNPKSIELKHLKMDPIRNRQIYQNICKSFGHSLIVFELNEMSEKKKAIFRGQMFLTQLPNLVNLQSLKFGKNIALSVALFDSILNGNKNIRSFSLDFNTCGQNTLKEENLTKVTQFWPLIERLEIINCNFIEQAFAQSLIVLSNLNYLNLTECSKLNDNYMPDVVKKLQKVNYLVLDKCHNLGKRTLDSVVLRAQRMSYELFRVSMIKCNLKNLPYLKSKLLPKNLRITYSTVLAKKYCTFDGQRTRFGNMINICQYINGK